MFKRSKLKVCFMGGNQSGVVGILTLLSLKSDILISACYSEEIKRICKAFGISVSESIKENKFEQYLKQADLLVSVHGREIVSKDLLCMPKYGAINVHPYLYKYKGDSPIKRALEDKNYKASVGVHKMVEEIDAGDTIIEKFIDVKGLKTEVEIYNKLYPYYSLVLIEAISKLV
jgi:methionyl-tRNA formyltransferase